MRRYGSARNAMEHLRAAEPAASRRRIGRFLRPAGRALVRAGGPVRPHGRIPLPGDAHPHHLPADRVLPMRPVPPYSKRSCSGLAACSGNGSQVVAPLGPVVRSSRRSAEMARARPSSSCKATLPSLWIPETTPSRHRPPSRRRNRTRSPAESPSLARAVLFSPRCCPSRRRLKLQPPRGGLRASARIGASDPPRCTRTRTAPRRRGSFFTALAGLVCAQRAMSARDSTGRASIDGDFLSQNGGKRLWTGLRMERMVMP